MGDGRTRLVATLMHIVRSVAGICIWVVVTATVNASAPDRPNILLVYVDDLGYGDLASFGHPIIKTPNLDKLASEGLRLTNYYAPSALCSPSRAGLLTGRYPYRSGIKSWIPENSGVYLRSEEITLAEILKDAGYATALIGKWHLNSDLASDTEPQPTDQGFEYFYGHNAFQIPTNRDPVNIFRNKQALGVQKGYTAELYASEAIAWIERRDKAKPFFLMFSSAEPHTTFENPAQYNEMYSKFTNGPVIPIPSGLEQIPKEKLIARGPGEYYANISFLDAQLGRVFNWMKDSGVDKNTVVVFASDNGPVKQDWLQWYEVNAYGSTAGLRGRKHFLYEGGIRVPAIIRYPGVIIAGSETDAPVVGMDLYVTLANIAGAAVPEDRAIDGIDVQTIFKGGLLPQRDLFWALPSASDVEFAVRSGPWKLLLNRQKQPVALHNLEEDPLELINLLLANNKQLERLKGKFTDIMAAIDADPLRPQTNN